VNSSRTFLRLACLVLGLGAWAAVAACSSGGGKRPATDGAVQDGFALDFRFGDVPAGCPPGVGNDKGVGASCSKTGSADCSGGLICACRTFLGFVPPPDTPCFCTVPILGRACDDPAVPAGICGQNATCCSYMQLGSICVPNVCLGSAMCPTL
jgi:hypothetical protein